MKINDFLLSIEKRQFSGSPEDLTRQLRSAIFESGSETDSNIACANQLAIASTLDLFNSRVLAIKPIGTDLVLADIVWKLEDDEVVNFLVKYFSEFGVSAEDLRAVLRFVTLTLSSSAIRMTED